MAPGVDATTGKVVVAAGGETGQQVTVATDADTKVIISDKPSTLADLKAGMSVRVVPPTGTATEIRVFTPKPKPTPPATQPRPLYGKVVSVDATTGKVVVAAGGETGQQVTVATDANTKVIISEIGRAHV